MAQRKASMLGSAAPGLAPRGSFSKPANVSPEYLDAVKVLSDDTMTQVCSLMLAEGGEEGLKEEQAELQHRQMLEIFEKCRKASEVINREAVSLLLPSMPSAPASRSAAAMASRTQAKPLGKGVPATKNIIPNRRMSRLTVPPPKLKRTILQRETSDSSQDVVPGRGTPVSMATAKKPRLSISPVPPAEPNVMEPPPSARNFLAKLNKDGSKAPAKKDKIVRPIPERAKAAPEKTRPERAKPPVPAPKPARPASPPTTRSPPKRVNPPRASRK